MTEHTFDKVSQKDAEKLLDKVQMRGATVRMRLCGVPVDVKPVDGNMFHITLDMALDGAIKAARRLNDIGADVTWPPVGIVKARVTWDSTLHYLTMTGDLA